MSLIKPWRFLKALQKQLDEMYTYIRNNQMMIPNYGEMRRDGEPVSTAFVESTINEVIARRMAKKQQMQWSRKGAHYLLQTRTPVGTTVGLMIFCRHEEIPPLRGNWRD